MVFTESEIKTIVETCLNKGVEEHLKTWNDVHEYLNSILAKNYKDSKTYRKVFNDYLIRVEGHEIKRDIQIEKVKMRDVNREYQASIRNEARIENLYEQILDAIREMPKVELRETRIVNSEAYALINVSDWHIGAKFDNYFGKYNSEIAKERINAYADLIIQEFRRYNVKEALILNMGDMIEGFIHVSTRIQAEMNAIDQSIYAGELFAQFIIKIHNALQIPLHVGSVLDNHSRIHPNKKEHIEAESLARVVMKFVEMRLQGTNINLVANVIDENIGFFNLGGKKIVWVHGHLDNPSNAKARLQEGLGFNIDELVMAHRHHIMMKSGIYQVPSMKGTDEYAKDKRLFGEAAQSFRIYEGNKKITVEVIF